MRINIDSNIKSKVKAYYGGIAKEKGLEDLYNKIDSNIIDGAFAGAHIKAYK